MVAVKVYDTSMGLKAYLENAFNVGYEQRLNEVHTARFSLPGDDPKNDECLAFRYVEIYDNETLVDLYRIMPDTLNKNQDSYIKTYECEHVLSTLANNILFQYHQTTNLSPTDTINYILSAQNTVNWQLGTVDFTAAYSYKWENENLLSALFSIPKAYNEGYQWTWDTTTTPWTLNLIRPSTTPSCYIRYRKNLMGITKETDPRQIITKLYPLGYGEGVNQLTIESVNGGQAYITATTTAYGTIEAIYLDKKEENATTLLAKAQAKLSEISIPRVTYSVDAADISSITQDDVDDFVIGAYVQVDDSETGINFTAQVVGKSKSNITENPGDIQLEISNKALDIADYNANIESRLIANDLYSQGAVNIDSNDYQDNCDSTHPATIKFYLPNETVRVNKCLLTFESSAFRAYETGAASGGGSTQSSSSGGSSTPTSSSEGYHDHQVQSSGTPSVTDSGGDPAHTHGFTDYIADYTVAGGLHTHTITIAAHAHDVTIPTHTHPITYGIYTYSASATAVTVKIDTATVTAITSTSITDFDIVPYLTKDVDGKITRAWHTVEITPNNLSRINASVVKQVFAQSRGGGDY